MQRRTGGPFSRLLASLSPVPADHYRYPTDVTANLTQIVNPYEANAITEPRLKRLRFWWWPVLVGFAISPLNILLDMGYGIQVMPRSWLTFPLGRPLAAMGIDDGQGGGVLFGLQFITYALILAVANLNRGLLRGAACVISLHFLSCLTAEPLLDLLRWLT
ncbi:hypothetical protein CA13_00880 [Planctomycetes bacterium CA13]|uniref:Uncharacterized protein n=1 Tax=Novipirellula herctigrandis TaxID=2527986 RepID=A0A5C5YUH5_9BACT|nr:hypothetical protein CA13_00880 [Planctomycetes bacterium CA13]